MVDTKLGTLPARLSSRIVQGIATPGAMRMHPPVPDSEKIKKWRQLIEGFPSILEFLPLARLHCFRRIDGLVVDLFVDDFPGFVDQEGGTPRGLHRNALDVKLLSQAIPAGHRAAPVAEDGKADTVLLGEGKVREGTVHTHTQNLGVCALQLREILLESFHFTGSTTGKGKDKERQGDVLLPPVILQ